jgi:hypothetical protein
MYGTAPEVEEGESPFGIYSEFTAPTSIQAFMGFNAMRGANTIMKGGFLDTNRTTRLFRRNNTLRRFAGSGASRRLTGTSYADMVGSRLRPGSSVFGGFFGRRRKLADLSVSPVSGAAFGHLDDADDIMRGLKASPNAKGIPTPKHRPRLINHLDPRSMFRYHSTSALTQAPGMYSPVGALAKTLGGVMQHTNIGKSVMQEAAAYRKAMSGHQGSVAKGLLAEGREAGKVREIMDYRRAGSDLELTSGGFLAYTRAGDQITGLERKIAARQAAGKDTTRLTRRLSTAQQSIKDIARYNNPGTDPFNTRQITLRQLQEAQVNARTTAGKKAGFFRSGSITARDAYFMEGTEKASDRVLTLTKKASTTPGGAATFEAIDELSGKTIQVNNAIGSSLYGSENTPGRTANILASQHRGQLMQRMHGYMQAAKGYGRAGGLTGQALAGAQSAARDMQILMEAMEGKGVATRAGFTTRAARLGEMQTAGRSFQLTGRELVDDITNLGRTNVASVRIVRQRRCCSS